MMNPWSDYRVTGSWEDHASYSEGGTDWPLGYGTALRAPAAGRLVNNGWVGTAGRRATFYFDQSVARVRPRSTTRMLGGYVEHDCDMVAFVFQHAKGYLGDAHFEQGALIGYSGASASGSDYGGDVHLHGHGLCVHGARVDFMKFVGASTAGGEYTNLEEDDMFNDDDRNRLQSVHKAVFEGGGDAGEAIIARLNKLEGRVTNIDRQVTGADGFDQPGQQSVAGRVIDIQSRGAVAGVDIEALAKSIVAQLPQAGLTAAAVADEFAKRLTA